MKNRSVVFTWSCQPASQTGRQTDKQTDIQTQNAT